MMKMLVLIAVSMAFVTGLPSNAQAARPNILFVIADQWRACSTGYAGDPNLQTPNLDKLAARSIDFTYAVSACPVCTPFRASMQTGQRPTTHGLFINDAHLADDATTIAKVLASAGYDTGYIGKWHIGGRGRLSYIPPQSRQGFDYWKVMECTHSYNRSFYYADDEKEKRLWSGYDAAAQTEDAIAYLRDHAKSAKPFALFLAWGPPHNPYEQAPPQFQKMYDAAKIELRPNVPPAAAPAARKDLAGYYANCTALDQYIGQLVEALKSAGIEDNTILVFTSDHGDMIGSHQMGRKQKPWDEALRVPMLWHYPAALGAAGKRVDAVISSEDLMPTLLGFCGVGIPKSVEGLDYSAYMRGSGENPNVGNAALISCVVPFGEWHRGAGGREFRGVRTARYTYVRDLNGPWLLYDNQTDPYQMTNLVGTPAAADVQAKLETLLQDRLKAANDDFKPADFYLAKWGYKDRVDKTGTLPTKP
jgi:arylsulfatase A-like enzyme